MLFAAVYFAYMFSRRLLFQENWEFVAFVHAEHLIAFEEKLFGLWEVTFERYLIDQATWAIRSLNWLYIITLWPMVALTAVVMFFTNRGRYRYCRNVVLLTFVVALLIFMAFPLAPPRMMTHYEFIDAIERLGPAFYNTRDGAVYFNAFAAMPSIHFGLTLLLGVMFWRTGPLWLKAAGVLYPTVTFLAIVGTGNHCMLDAVGAGVMVLASVLLYAALLPSRPKTEPLLSRGVLRPLARMWPDKAARGPRS